MSTYAFYGILQYHESPNRVFKEFKRSIGFTKRGSITIPIVGDPNSTWYGRRYIKLHIKELVG